MFSPPDFPHGSPSPSSLTHLTASIFSYNGNIMLAAIISLLLVILFVLFLHIYAKWFLNQSRNRRRNSMVITDVLAHTRFRTVTFDSDLSSFVSKGLDSSLIASIPLFVFKSDEIDKLELECVVCLSCFEDGDIGRRLRKCGHGFHVECIDMWLYSHSNCPICRAPVVTDDSVDRISTLENAIDVIPISQNENDVMDDDPLSSSPEPPEPPASPPSSSMACSLTRMLSRNRSDRKVHQSPNVNELGV